MVKFVALWRKPEDPAAFDAWYLGPHMAICREYPDAESIKVARVTGTPRGESEFHMMFEAVYPDRDTMMASLTSEPGMRSAMDARGSGFGSLMNGFFVEDVDAG